MWLSRGGTQYVQKTSVKEYIVSWTALISLTMGGFFYLEEAFTVFSKQNNQDVVSYNAMTSGYMQNNKGFSVVHNHDV